MSEKPDAEKVYPDDFFIEDSDLGTERLKLKNAAEKLYEASADKEHLEIKHWLWVALCGAEDLRPLGVSKCAETVKAWLAKGDVDSVARFGRLAAKINDDSGFPGGSQEAYFYKVFSVEIRLGHLPTKEFFKEEGGCSERTIQRCFNRISEESGLSLDARESVNVWTDPPS